MGLGVGGANLVQQGRWQFADLGHEPLQLFARQRRNADIDPLSIGEQFGILYGGVKRAPQRGKAIGGDAGRGEKGGADLGRIHDGAEDRALLVVAGELDGGGNVGEFGVPLERELDEESGWATLSAVHEVE